MVVNDDAGHQVTRRVLATIASMLAPPGVRYRCQYRGGVSYEPM